MSVGAPQKTRRHPANPPSADVMWEAMLGHQAATRQLVARHQDLLELLQRIETPATFEPIQLTAVNNPIESGAHTERTLSIGLYNPQNVGPVQFSVQGSASAADAFVLAAGKLIVLPISAGIVEIGTNVALGAGQSLYCFLLRYKTVQPAFLGG